MAEWSVYAFMLGGRHFPEIMNMPDDEIKTTCKAFLNAYFDVEDELEDDIVIKRLQKAIPQYKPGHIEKMFNF